MKPSPTSSSRSSCSSSNAESHSVVGHNASHRQTYTISTIGQKLVLMYEGQDVKCYCGKKAPLWVSWTDFNPGRRFLTCGFFNRCKFHRWVDDEMQDRAKEVIIGLRNREKELVASMDMLANDGEELRQKEAMVMILKNDAKELKEENERLKLVVSKQISYSDKMRRRMWLMFCCWIVATFMYVLAL